MEQQEVKAPSFYRPSLGDESQKGLDHSVEEGLKLASFDQCETVGDMDDSQLIGASETVSVANHDMAAGEVGGTVNVEENLAEKGVVEKRRRGRPPGSGRPPRGSVKTTVFLRKKKDEEDVCFICFDGGSLVLCDRRGCPKAYHPACIKRDDSFFRSKAKWNCGWHICNSCQKASYYMCYTCPYSWCKGCTKDADYQCIRGNKGLCGTCMRTVMLIENLQENKESVHVDFDDKSSWEYLFKVYWTFLKDKLSLTSDEVIRAKNPWKAAPVMASNEESPCELYNTNNDKVVSVSSNSYKDLGSINLKRERINKKPIVPNTNSVSVEESDGQIVMPIPGETTWASKELLEFVSHMKNGDMSVLSKFDVQGLLHDYIKKNNLRNPRQKCQIVCDSRFLNLFGKARLGHIEMLKLLESHFLTKEESLVNHTVRVGPVDAVSSQANSCWNHDNQTMMVNNKRRKMHKRVNEGASQPDPDSYAAIDVHNINLIYLRRHLMENLMDNAEKFHDKVVGSIVRIKVSGSDQKQDIYRLVQVVGTCKVMEPYNVGTKTTDVMLEILNLDKKEVISIDGISNQEFSQDECGRLRQSIKCGLIKCLTVREVQDKARALLAVKLRDCLESEVMLLNHLRDRASEKGHIKELRECVEKLQLLNSPEEHQRRFQEVPVVHSDPSMDPCSESEGIAREIDKKKQDDKDKMGSSGFSRKRREPISPRRRGGISIKDRGKTHKLLVTPCEQSRGKETFGRNGWNTTKNNDCPSGSINIDWGNGAVVQSDMPRLLSETNQSTNDMETDRMWHYKDPTGKVQGPFCMLQLRKWSMSGHFPPDLRIWRINEKQDSSVLLTKALTEEYSKVPLLAVNSHLLSCDAKIASDGRDNCSQGLHGQRNDGTRVNPVDDKRFNGIRNHKQDEPSKHIDSGNEPPVSEQSSLSSICTATINSGEGHVGVFSQGCDSLKDNNFSTSPLIPGKQDLSDQVGECQESERASTQNDGCINSHQNAKSQINNNHQDCENRSDSEGHSGQSSEHNWRDPCLSSSTCGLDSKPDFVLSSKPFETSEPNQVVIDFSNVSCPTPKPSSVKLECLPADNKHLQSSNAPVHDAGVSWSTTSSVVAGPYLHEVAGEWGGFSSTSTKPSIEEWDSSLVSVSSLKPIEVASDCAATPASVNNELTHSSPSHRASHASGWQALVTEPGDFCSLFEESVSDLLAEVEAMETLHRTPSSPSIINYGGELTDSSRNDYLSSVKAFSPALESGKGDALSSSGDVHLALQLTLTSEPLGAGKSDYLDSQKTVNGHSSSSGEVEGDTKHSDVSVNQLETGLDIQPAVPSSASWGMASTDTPWSARPEDMDPNWGAVQASTHLSLVGSIQGNAIMSESAPMQEKSSMNAGSSSGGMLGSQTRNGNERILNSRDRLLHSRDSSFGSGRHAWNRQPYFGGGNGFSQRSTKGQRICKYYESGYCKKGSSCSFWHP